MTEKKRRRREKPKLVRKAGADERCPVCNGKKPGRFYGVYRRRVWNTAKPDYRYTAEYCAHGSGSAPSPNGNGPQHVIAWCYVKGSCKRVI
jgi:hypothetical protein